MIVRIVQMTFKPDLVNQFIRLFEERKEMIRNFNGCKHLELWQGTGNNCIFFTYSIWESEKHLDHYRFSEFFKNTWMQTKVLFSEKPRAWSVNRMTVLE